MKIAGTIGRALMLALALLAMSPQSAPARVGVTIGVPLGPWIYPAPYYYPPYPLYPYPYAHPYGPYVYPYPPAAAAPPSGYVDQAPPAPSVYYYCPAARGYYPYVRECPGGWEHVPAQPR